MRFKTNISKTMNLEAISIFLSVIRANWFKVLHSRKCVICVEKLINIETNFVFNGDFLGIIWNGFHLTMHKNSVTFFFSSYIFSL